MTMTVQTLGDREEIRELRHRFGAALDTRDWPAFEALFTPDATGDFRSFGVPSAATALPELVQMFRRSFARPADELATQQVVSNFLIEIHGNSATSSSYLEGHHRIAGHSDGEEVTLRARYDDELVRTAHGWRISRTTLHVISVSGNAAILAG